MLKQCASGGPDAQKRAQREQFKKLECECLIVVRDEFEKVRV